MSLHTSAEPNCSVAGSGQSGTLLTNDCAFANSYTGCAVTSNRLAGADLNAVGGGVFAMLWTSQGMEMWTFERDAIPPSISNRSATPLLAEFGAPVANFQGSCNFDAHFRDQQMIFNTDFCGSNAGNTFQMHGCPMVSLAGEPVSGKELTCVKGHRPILGFLQHLRCQQPTSVLGIVLGGELS